MVDTVPCCVLGNVAENGAPGLLAGGATPGNSFWVDRRAFRSLVGVDNLCVYTTLSLLAEDPDVPISVRKVAAVSAMGECRTKAALQGLKDAEVLEQYGGDSSFHACLLSPTGRVRTKETGQFFSVNRKVWLRGKEFRPAPRAMYAVLRDHTKADQTCSRTREQLAARLDRVPRQVTNILKPLVHIEKLVSVQPGGAHYEGSDWDGNLYHMKDFAGPRTGDPGQDDPLQTALRSVYYHWRRNFLQDSLSQELPIVEPADWNVMRRCLLKIQKHRKCSETDAALFAMDLIDTARDRGEGVTDFAYINRDSPTLNRLIQALNPLIQAERRAANLGGWA